MDGLQSTPPRHLNTNRGRTLPPSSGKVNDLSSPYPFELAAISTDLAPAERATPAPKDASRTVPPWTGS